jgi:hypothetical protein
MIAEPDYALIDHWNDGLIQIAIRSGSYDYVIVQQGPSSQEFGRAILIEYGKKIKTLCDQNNTKLMYYMVWPSKRYFTSFSQVIHHYYEAAQINNALVCPVGEVLKTRIEQDPRFKFYSSDGFHPSLEGSRFIAQLLYDCILF